jgi:hypothetical protein
MEGLTISLQYKLAHHHNMLLCVSVSLQLCVKCTMHLHFRSNDGNTNNKTGEGELENTEVK